MLRHAPILLVSFAIVCFPATGAARGLADGPATASSASPVSGVPGACTMALPSLLVTIEVRIAGAADFCEIASQGLGGDIFHRSLFVTPNVLWHYRADSISCQLRFRRTTSTITIRNSASSCRWFARTTTGWHRDNAGYA